MDFSEAIRNGFRNYGSATGRASRSEFWYWVIFSSLCGAAGNVVDLAIFHDIDSGLVAPLISLALLLPDVAVSIRRLHDLDRSGWWLLISLTGVGLIVLLVWDCMRGTLGPNRFGPDALAPSALPVATQI